jgi:beta-glucosidase
VLASVKHFVGDGGTTWGTTRLYDWLHGNFQAPGASYSIDQGDMQVDEAALRAVPLRPYGTAIEAGALNIMVSFSSWQGVKMHAHEYLLTDVLKGEMGFRGFLVSDWMAVSQLDRDYSASVVSAINAGIDMVMVPYDFRQFIETLTQAVQSGAVSEARIDDSVRRILRAKEWLGLFESPYGRDDLLPEVGSPAHRAIAREAVQKSLVLLKNEGDLLPLPKTARVLVAGKGAHDIGMQCGGWSISWQGDHGAITEGTSILDGIRQTVQDAAHVVYSVDGVFEGGTQDAIGIVVVGESPYAEGMGDSATLALTETDCTVVGRMRAQCSQLVVILISGRPLIVTDTIEQADAFVAAWLPGTEGQGIADVLFGDAPFSGRLSYAWPRTLEDVPLSANQNPLFPLGFGITTRASSSGSTLQRSSRPG